MNYYLTINNQTVGPMSAQQVVSYPVDPQTQVNYNNQGWRPLYTYPELMLLYNQARGQNYNTLHTGGAYNPEVNSKKVMFGVLALLVGTLGVQYFAIGRVGAGFLTILISLVTCGIWSIVVLIQGILVLCMSDRDFENKFLNSTNFYPLF